MSKADTLRKILKAAVTNWPIKLMALVLAVVLWAVVTAEETTTQLVPVVLEIDAPEGRTMAGDLPPVQARFRGTLRELLKLYENPPIIHKDVPATAGASRSILLSTADLRLVEDAAVDALEVLPESVTVELDDIHTKEVPVVSRVDFRTDPGFEVFGPAQVLPRMVTLKGPEVLVSPLQTAATIRIERSGLREPTEYTVDIDTSGFGLVSVEPAAVRVIADIGEVSTRVLMGVVVNVDGPDGQWYSTTSAVSVTVRGRASRIRLFTRDSVRVVARPSGLQDMQTVLLDVLPPEGVTGNATPDSVEIRRSDGT